MRFLLFCAGATVAAAVYVPGKAFDRFFTIWLENQDFAKVDKDADMLALTKQGILLTSYYGLTHPSQPNYIASVGGDYFGLDHDEFVRIPNNVSTLVDLLDEKGVSWKGYFEGIPGPGYMGMGSTALDGSGWDYVRKHNPFISFDSVNLNGTRLAQIQSFTDFAVDVAKNSLPQYAHLSPDMLNDGHNTTLQYATNWSTSFISPLLSNPTFMERTLILLTYDESETYSIPNKIVSILLGGAVPKNLQGTKDDTVYTHYSILSTLQNNWNLANLGRYDVGANVFSLVASQTGYTNHLPSNLNLINNSLSYGGFMNSNQKKYLPIPPPNLQLIGAGGQGVHASVEKFWGSAKNELTPYDGSGVLYDGGDGTKDVNAPVYKAPSPAADFTGSASPTATSKSAGSRIRLRFCDMGVGIGIGVLGSLLGAVIFL